ncbi:hypothetical protein HMPREF0724_12387 [Prescottella equi ATCC 33707]|uniref:Uncharacterized protein n=1 Tax=Prescottella equi ATCC 33707 TaxID=525370 RepID=E9T178_RHOHA|nr:hypothetical protein HMPREF0724_12387 [Prescottella equi ATCC 33707]
MSAHRCARFRVVAGSAVLTSLAFLAFQTETSAFTASVDQRPLRH